jgi:hypothetical protein
MTSSNDLQRQINSLAERMRGVLATQVPPLVTYAGNPDTNLEAQAGTLCWDTANFDLYVCISNPSGTDWQLLGGGSGASGAPVSAQYLTLAFNATLTGERRFQAGDGLTGTDGGANGDYTLAVALAADLLANLLGFTGGEIDLDTQNKNLAFMSDTAVDGQKPSFRALVEADLPGSYAPDDAQYLTLALDGDLSAERLFNPGYWLGATDGGADGAYTLDTLMDTVLVHDGSSVTGEYADLASAITAATSGDTILLPPGTYSGDHTVPTSVTVAGMNMIECELTGEITLSAGSYLVNAYVHRSLNTADNEYGVIFPRKAVGVGHLHHCKVEVINAGAGTGYDLKLQDAGYDLNDYWLSGDIHIYTGT